MMNMRRAVYKKGFTLVELMVALIVTGIIMSAIATLAFAFSSAYDASDDTDRKQAQVRYASLRISELIRHCKLICARNGGDLVIWRDDDVSGGEGIINPEELVYIETDSNRIRMMDFSNCPSWLRTSEIHLNELQDSGIKTTLMAYCDEVEVISECSNVQFKLFSSDYAEITEDEEVANSRFVNISFELTENDMVRQYHIDSALRCWAGHLLNDTGTDLVSDDD